VDAFDTILHLGQIGEVYNIGSTDEISNIKLCEMLLQQFGHVSAESFSDFVIHTIDRPFNDRRYAVDDSKLRKLGWQQKTSFDDALKATVAWYRQFGEAWWGDIGHVLVPHPAAKISRTLSSTSGRLSCGSKTAMN
jgi:dTDP-D-glucose 4,6-dehydratase